MDRHLTALGVIYLVFSALNLMAACIVFLVVAGSGAISGNPHAMMITGTVASLISGFLVVISIPGLVGGIGLLKHKSWSRYLGLVLGCINLLHIPVGTAIGVYTIWVLTRPEAVTLLEGKAG